MAAHIITAIRQTEEDIKLNRLDWKHLNAALSLSCWTEDINLDEYRELMTIVELENIDRLITWINLLKPKYTEIWFNWGCPNNREQWHEIKYHEWKKENKS